MQSLPARADHSADGAPHRHLDEHRPARQGRLRHPHPLLQRDGRLEKEESFYGSGVDVNTAVSKLFGVSRSTVFFYRRLEKLIAPLLDAYDKRQITQAVANMLCDLPQELQEYIYEQRYHLLMDPAMCYVMKKVTTKEEIDAIIKGRRKPREKFEYLVATKIAKPSNFDLVPLAVDHKEVDAFKEFLTQALDLADGLSDHTKQVIRKMLQA